MLNRVFVYGSLRQGGYYHHVIAPYAATWGPAALDGVLLYQVAGHYPGMVPGDGTVLGDVIELAPERLADAMADLDRLEEYFGPNHPDNLYERIQVTVRGADGTSTPAWVYMWLGEVEEAARVPGGDWLAWWGAREKETHDGE